MPRVDSRPVRPAALARLALFGDLPAMEIARIADSAQTVQVVAGEPVVRRGDEGLHLFLVQQGRLRVSASATPKSAAILTELGAGDYFGELALLDGDRRSADVDAISACRLIRIDRENFLRLVERNPRVADRLATGLRRDLILARSAIRSGELADIPARLTAAIRKLSLKEGRSGPMLEILPVQLKGHEIRWYRPQRKKAWQVPCDPFSPPGEVVLQTLLAAGVSPVLVHSTSWRYEHDHLVLTYLAVIGPSVQSIPGLSPRRAIRAKLAHGALTSPPESIGISQVIEHGLRHLSWLIVHDPVIGNATGESWNLALERYQPEPFRAIGSGDPPLSTA